MMAYVTYVGTAQSPMVLVSDLEVNTSATTTFVTSTTITATTPAKSQGWSALSHCTLKEGSLDSVGNASGPSVASNASNASDASDASEHLVVILGDAKTLSRSGSYRLNRQLWECYQSNTGVQVRFLQPRCFKQCGSYSDFFMVRLCAMAELLAGFLEDGGFLLAKDLGLQKVPRWIFHMDGDTLLVTHPMLTKVTSNWTQQVVLYERFHSAEIVAGNYALQVTNTALAFLRGWLQQAPLAKGVKFNNSDNGLLHFQVLDFLGLDRTVSTNVSEAYARSKDLKSYDRFVARVKLALGPRRVYDEMLIQRRGLGFCSDDVTPIFHSQLYFCHHAVKWRHQLLRVSNGDEKCLERSLECRQSFSECVSSDEKKLQSLLRGFRSNRAGLGKMNDIATCWPDCPANIPEDLWKRMAQGLKDGGTLP